MKVYHEIDVDGLSTVLAEEAWKEETKNTNLNNLYEDGATGPVKKEWEESFGNLKGAVISLILFYKKPEDGISEERGTDQQRVSI